MLKIKLIIKYLLIFLVISIISGIFIFLSFISLDFENGLILIKQIPQKANGSLVSAPRTKEKNTITWDFLSRENNLGAIDINFGSTGATVFRIRKSDTYLHYQNGFKTDRFEIDQYTSFDFPIIAKSKEKKYTMEVEFYSDKKIPISQINPNFVEINKFTYNEFFNKFGFSWEKIIKNLIYALNINTETRIFLSCYFTLLFFYFIHKKFKKRFLLIIPILYLIPGSIFIALSGLNSQIILFFVLLIFAIIIFRLKSGFTFFIALIYLLLGIVLFEFYKNQVGSKLSLIAYLSLVIGSVQLFLEIISNPEKNIFKPSIKSGIMQKYKEIFYIKLRKIYALLFNPGTSFKYLRIKINYFLASDILSIVLIILVVQWFTQFKWGEYLFTGDFRFNIFQNMIDDQYLSLISNQFSSNNFIYLTFYSIFYLFQFIPYQYVVLYLLHGIPILLFLSMKYVLLKIIHYKRNNFVIYLFVSSIALYYAINPALFLRYVHWTILHSNMLLPLFIYLLFKFLQNKNLLGWYFFLLPLVAFFGAMVPHGVVVYALAALVLYISVYFIYRPSIKKYLIKGILLSCIYLLSFIHIIYPVLIGYGQTKSSLESASKSYFMAFFSRNSNIYTSISGTNFFDQLISYPSSLSIGLLMFLLVILFFIFKNSRNKINFVLFLSILLSLIFITGYKTFGDIFDLLNLTYITHLLWLVKDPNMYYLVFLILLSFLFTRVVVFSSISKFFILILSLLLISLNLNFILKSEKTHFNNDFDFVKVPDEYLTLSDRLEKDKGRNFWYPNNVYVSKNFSKDVICFPTPQLWLTRNKELLSYLNPDYKNLVNIISTEIYENKCKNINFLDWIISAQSLNVILDKNSVNNRSCPKDNTAEKIKLASSCMSQLPNIYKYKTIGNIDIYKSKLLIKDSLYTYEGDVSGLDKYLKNNPVNIIYKESKAEKIQKIDLTSFSILNEAYDKNWLDENNKPPLYKANIVSMLYEGQNRKFHYRGESEFQKIVSIQKALLVLSGLLFIILSIKEKIHEKKYL